MSICEECNGEMQEVSSCREDMKVDFGDGVSDPIRYGSETPAFSGDRCHDCNVEKGGIHHPGCDVERCPRRGGQLIGCGCLDS